MGHPATKLFARVRNLITGSDRRQAAFTRRGEGVMVYSTRPHGVPPLTATPLGGGFAHTTERTTAAAIGSLAVRVNALIRDAVRTRHALAGFIDETHAHVVKVQNTQDQIGSVTWEIPRDYDSGKDILKFRMLAGQLTQFTDTDVRLLVAPAIRRQSPENALIQFPDVGTTGTLAVVEAWLEFDLSKLGLIFGDKLILELHTDGTNDTTGEEVLIHDLELQYTSVG